MSVLDGAPEAVGRALEPVLEVDVRWALLALVVQLCNLACRATCWRNVLAAAFPDERLSTFRVGLAYAVGAGLNGYLPARGGDAVKVGLVKLQAPRTSAVAVASSTTVLVLFDACVGVALLAAGWLGGALPGEPPLPGPVKAIIASPAGATAAAVLAVAVTMLLVRRAGTRLRTLTASLAQGVAVLRSPGRYVRTVLSVQALAWCCRIGVVYCLLLAFGIAATVPLAALVVVVGGMSTLVPVPGGAGAQQALAVFVLAGVASTSTAIGYSIGAQVGITVVNTTIAAIAAMLLFGRLHPVRALRDAVAQVSLRPVAEPVP